MKLLQFIAELINRKLAMELHTPSTKNRKNHDKVSVRIIKREEPSFIATEEKIIPIEVITSKKGEIYICIEEKYIETTKFRKIKNY